MLSDCIYLDYVLANYVTGNKRVCMIYTLLHEQLVHVTCIKNRFYAGNCLMPELTLLYTTFAETLLLLSV